MYLNFGNHLFIREELYDQIFQLFKSKKMTKFDITFYWLKVIEESMLNEEEVNNMRCNQVTIDIERFGEYVPSNYPSNVQKIRVYVDDFNSIYAALSKAYALAINELSEYEKIGARSDVYTNEFSKGSHQKMHGTIIESKNKYEQDENIHYIDTNIELCKDRIWIYENAESILTTLRECEGTKDFVTVLKDKFDLTDYQIRKISQIRFDMMTKYEYEQTKQKLEELELKINKKGFNQLYFNNKKRQIKQQIEELEAYFIMLDNYSEISKLILDSESDDELLDALKEKYGISKRHAQNFKYFTLNDFIKEKQEKNKDKLEHLRFLLTTM